MYIRSFIMRVNGEDVRAWAVCGYKKGLKFMDIYSSQAEALAAQAAGQRGPGWAEPSIKRLEQAV